MESNKLIKLMLNGTVKTNEDFFGVFCLFANGLTSFEDVLKTAEKNNMNIVDICNKNNLSFEKIVARQ